MTQNARRSLNTADGRAVATKAVARQDCDAYLISIVRALDARIARVSDLLARLPIEPGRNPRAEGEHRELTRRLADLQSARADLLDVAFRSRG